ncbi:UPF0175 family protein [Halorussus amylolyticus]|uniref:UPF0175 family protein n=1 Tax=Halorussus amylolyticus TaxID=1126242 RepID=UPI0010503847|nr:UPF0175 family protein [Halorussus amylolyticus]
MSDSGRSEVEIAIQLYRERLVSLGRAAEIADVSVWCFLDILNEFGVEMNYDESDLEIDLAAVES